MIEIGCKVDFAYGAATDLWHSITYHLSAFKLINEQKRTTASQNRRIVLDFLLKTAKANEMAVNIKARGEYNRTNDCRKQEKSAS
jgi:hypothetical protein